MNDAKQKSLHQLVTDLYYKGGYADNTSYCKEFRANKLLEMISKITYFLYDDKANKPKALSLHEHYALTLLIREISAVIAEKSHMNKKAVIISLKELELLSK